MQSGSCASRDPGDDPVSPVDQCQRIEAACERALPAARPAPHRSKGKGAYRLRVGVLQHPELGMSESHSQPFRELFHRSHLHLNAHARASRSVGGSAERSRRKIRRPKFSHLRLVVLSARNCSSWPGSVFAPSCKDVQLVAWPPRQIPLLRDDRCLDTGSEMRQTRRVAQQWRRQHRGRGGSSQCARSLRPCFAQLFSPV